MKGLWALYKARRRADYKRIKSSRAVAKIYGVDKKIILFIVDPEYKKRDAKRQQEQEHWKIYYNKDKHTKDMRKYRAKKRQEGLCKTPTPTMRGVIRDKTGKIKSINLKTILPCNLKKLEVKNFLKKIMNK